MPEIPELGVRATVVMDDYTHGPRTLDDDDGAGLRKVTVFPGPSEDFYVDGAKPGTPDHVLALDSTRMEEPLVEEISIVSHYALHVALYALQQLAAETGTPYGRTAERALKLIGTSGDCEHHIDPETLMPLPVEPPSDWEAV